LDLIWQCCNEYTPDISCCIIKQSFNYVNALLTPSYRRKTWWYEYTHLFYFICIKLNNWIFKNTSLKFRLETIEKFSSNIILYALNTFKSLKIIEFHLSEKQVGSFVVFVIRVCVVFMILIRLFIHYWTIWLVFFINPETIRVAFECTVIRKYFVFFVQLNCLQILTFRFTLIF